LTTAGRTSKSGPEPDMTALLYQNKAHTAPPRRYARPRADQNTHPRARHGTLSTSVGGRGTHSGSCRSQNLPAGYRAGQRSHETAPMPPVAATRRPVQRGEALQATQMTAGPQPPHALPPARPLDPSATFRDLFSKAPRLFSQASRSPNHAAHVSTAAARSVAPGLRAAAARRVNILGGFIHQTFCPRHTLLSLLDVCNGFSNVGGSLINAALGRRGRTRRGISRNPSGAPAQEPRRQPRTAQLLSQGTHASVLSPKTPRTLREMNIFFRDCLDVSSASQPFKESETATKTPVQFSLKGL
jgi:hypothetical protein